MMMKLPVLGAALVTALCGTALASEPCDVHGAPVGHGYGPPVGGYPPAARGPAGRHPGSYRHAPPVAPRVDARHAAAELRGSDLNRDGWVTLDEALARGRREFARRDRDRNHVLTRREIGPSELGHDDRDRDGRVTRREHQSSVRAHFARLDVNRDGWLGRHELGLEQPRPRSAGWWSRR